MLDFNDAGSQVAYKSSVVPVDDPVVAFSHALLQHDMKPDIIEADGCLHRFDVEKKNDKAGWYVFFLGEKISAGVFGNWKVDDEGHKWCSKEKSQMTHEELLEHNRMNSEGRRLRVEELARIRAKCRETSRAFLETAPAANPWHQYLLRKKVESYGLYQDRYNNLVMPLYDFENVCHGYERIPEAEGVKKKLKFGTDPTGHFFFIGQPPKHFDKICICEGYATGATIYKSTGLPVVIARNTGNLKPTGEVWRKHYPCATLVFCADDDYLTGNAGIKAATEAAQAVNGLVVVPSFPEEGRGEKDTDFNDMLKFTSHDEIKARIESQIIAGQPNIQEKLTVIPESMTRLSGRLIKRPPPTEYILHIGDKGLIPKGVVGVITAAGGTGKSFFLGALAYIASCAGTFGMIRAVEKIKTLSVFCEDPQEEVERRMWDICKGVFPDDLHVLSTYGLMEPLMRLDGNTPVRAGGFYWLEEMIKAHPGLRLLILEPKSRFYGLDENNNDHATQWVACLEYLARKYMLTILISHHTGKEEGGRISQKMSRGASGLVDACRWQAGLARLDKSTAEKLGIKNYRKYILFDTPKANYSEDIEHPLVFGRGDNGVLEYYDPKAAKRAAAGDSSLRVVVQALENLGGSTAKQVDFIKAVVEAANNGISSKVAQDRIKKAVFSGAIEAIIVGRTKTYIIGGQ